MSAVRLHLTPIVVAKALAVMVLWTVAETAFTEMPPLLAIGWLLLLLGAFGWLSLRWAPACRGVRCRALLRLRKPGAAAVAALAAAILIFCFQLAIACLLVHYGQLRLQVPDHGVVQQYLNRRWGWAPVAVSFVFVAPIIEEFVFRGWIQHSLERRIGTWPAIGIAAALFAAVHGNGPADAFHFVFGVLAGYLVYATGSIWAGVLLHAGNNLSVMIAGLLLPERLGTPDGMVSTLGVWPLAVVAVVSGVLLLRLAGALPVRRRRPHWMWSARPARPGLVQHGAG
ncbi:MAG TPA: CPBP family intramembrane glutamic endopeptidase [Longimicrobiaceae bacterium]|nr:CPBP family intramembrane glutamic endopeptidase [Longimicrobiaceae bacterium]